MVPENPSKPPALEPYLQSRFALEPDSQRGDKSEALHQIISRAQSLMHERQPGARKVRVTSEGAERSGRTTLEVLIDDRPFAVDTFRLTLQRLGLRERRLLFFR